MAAASAMTSETPSATQCLEELIQQFDGASGPLERVVGEWEGSEAANVASLPGQTVAGQRAAEMIDDLDESWGPNGDPSWVDGLVEGRPDDGHGLETDFVFGLYHRPGFFAFVRLRGDNDVIPRHVRLILGVVRMPRQ